MAAPAVLLLARLLPAEGLGLTARLAAAAVCLLILPGALVVRALRWPSDLLSALAGAVAFSLLALGCALAATFAVGASFTLALILVGAIALVAFGPAVLAPPIAPARSELLALAGIAVAGAAFAVAVALASGPIAGDGFFHLGRARKLAELDELSSLHAVNEFRDGGLHPGYAFPLWHAFLAATAELAGVDPADVVRHLSAVLVPLGVALAYAAGYALFRSPWPAVAVALAHVAHVGLAPGNGGGYTSLALPASAGRQLLVPLLLALAFAWLAEPAAAVLAALAAAALVLALVHPTYAFFVAVPLAGYVVARTLLTRSELRRGAAALAAILVPAGAVALWLLPLVRETASHSPSAEEVRRALAKYAGQLDVSSVDSYRLVPELYARGGAVAVAALVLIPVAALAARRRWAAFVLGGCVAVLVLTLVPALFTQFSDAVSLSQARRIAGFLPFAFAFAGGAAVLARLLGVVVLPVALAAGIALQLAFPGDFGYRLEEGGPPLATWVALVGGGAALAGAAAYRRALACDRRDLLVAVAAALFVLPVAVQAFAGWPARDRPSSPLTPGLTAALNTTVPKRAVVFSDLATSYRISAAAPVYVAAASPPHVADTEANRPYERARDVARFFRERDLGIPRRYGARWIVIDKRSFRLRLRLPRAYEDPRYVLYRLR